MTNYSKWDKFDPDLVCKEIEVQQAVESSKLAKKKVFQAVASENEQSILEAKRNAEALQSQAEVAALKARGMGGRRKAKAKDAELPSKADNSTNPATLPSPVPAPPKARSLADKLHAVTDFLFRLLKQVEQIRVCTEKKSSHNEGYTACVQCLQDIHVFSRIKNATVMAALRASGSGGDSAEGGSGVPDTTVKIIEDLNESESFLIEQTVNCLSLFALSRGEFALSAECSRFVLKRQGTVADAGIWIMRGLALAAMGVPYLAKLHFASAAAANSDYLGMRECAEVVDKEVHRHARLTVKASRQELITYELARALRSHFHPTTHLLNTTSDLAVLTVAEVNSILAESSVEGDVYGVFVGGSSGDSAGGSSSDGNGGGSIHMDEEAASSSTAANITCEIINTTLLHLVTTNITISTNTSAHPTAPTAGPTTEISPTNKSSPYGAMVHNTRSTLALHTAEHAKQVLVVLAGLEMVRKLFYEAQVLYLENIYQTAEVKYSAVILLINSVKTLIADVVGGMKLADVVTYLDNVLSTCYVNIGCSMVHHSVRLRMIGTTSTITTTTNITNTTTNTTTTNTTNTTGTTAMSVNDLIGSSVHSTLYTPLHYIDAGLRVCDTVSGRFRKLYVLEKMHRFKEGLEECEHILSILNNSQFSTHTGVHVADTLSASSLGQEYMAGFVLPMPVASVLGSGEGSGGGSGSGSSSSGGSNSVVCIDDSAGVDADLDREFDMLFNSTASAGGSAANVRATTSHTPSDAVVQARVWRAQLQKKVNTFEFLIRKHGLQ